jgi:hypothetical protein
MTPRSGSGRHLWDYHPHVRSHDQLTFGEKSADVMRNAFGSWAFVGAFLLFMAVWMVFNTVVLKHLGLKGFDPYPYILLNLALSMMAGLQGALILIAAKRADRVAAEQATAHYAETSKLDELLATNTTPNSTPSGRLSPPASPTLTPGLIRLSSPDRPRPCRLPTATSGTDGGPPGKST